MGAFVQDDWKITQRLTLNLGFRWDLLTWPFEQHNRQAALNPTTGTIDLAGVNGVPRSTFDNNFNYAPRVGFAWDPYGNGHTSLRGQQFGERTVATVGHVGNKARIFRPASTTIPTCSARSAHPRSPTRGWARWY